MLFRRIMHPLLVVSCLSVALVAQEAPPTQQDMGGLQALAVGEVYKTPAHGSRWEYPKEVKVLDGTQLYIVQKGDTFWDLGAKFLGNPFAWPQIWEQNKWIQDPHWIYPGNPLLIPMKNTALAKAGESPDGPRPEVDDLQPDGRAGYRRTVLDEMAFTFQDFVQMPFIAVKGFDGFMKDMGGVAVVDAERRDQFMHGDGEKIYLDGGKNKGIKVGDRRVLIKVAHKRHFHPDDRRMARPMGDVLHHVGIARFVQVDERSAVAVIERAMDPVELGDGLVPYAEPASIPMVLRTDVAEPLVIRQPVAKVVYARDQDNNIGTSQMVVIDKGAKEGFKVGDVLISAEERGWEGGASSEGGGNVKPGGTNLYMGQLLVVRVDEHTATCRVLRAIREMGVGTIAFK